MDLLFGSSPPPDSVGTITEGNVHFLLNGVKNNDYAISVGISKVQGFAPINVYLHPNNAIPQNIRFQLPVGKNKESICEILPISTGDEWSGVPLMLPIVKIDGADYVDMSKWIYNLSAGILFDAYIFLDVMKILDNVTEVSTHLISLKKLKNGSIKLTGTIKSGKPHETTDYSIAYSMIFYKLTKSPMIGRVGNPKIGYFHNDIYIDERSRMVGQPVAIIHRKNLKKMPWIYTIDHSIPYKYHSAVKTGVLSWNNYFENLGLGSPFKVICHDDKDYPNKEQIDVFDASGWYICGTEIGKFNGPHSGYAIQTTDYRSGENIFGLISLNIIKIASNPLRHMKMVGIDNDILGEEYVNKYISWVTAHEIGHQLGLRHNFMGNLQFNGFGSVMDYIDVFTDFTNLDKLDVQSTNREYDLTTIKYGYINLEDEITGIEHPQLTKIADESKSSFGTDENYEEGINPYIGKIEDNPDPLVFVEKMIPLYEKYRSNLISQLKSGDISPYEHNSLFVFLYTNQYNELINMCLKFVGGRMYHKDRKQYDAIPTIHTIHSIELLMKLMKAIEYTSDEYSHFIHDIGDNFDRQVLNRLDMGSLYTMNVVNLYKLYQNMIIKTLRGILDEKRLLRLETDNNKEFNIYDMLNMVTFSEKSNGIFSEIGNMTTHENLIEKSTNRTTNSNANESKHPNSITKWKWQSDILTVNPMNHSTQYHWVLELIRMHDKTELYMIRLAIHSILNTIKSTISQFIIPYVDSINKSYRFNDTRSGGNNANKIDHNKVRSHWGLILDLITNNFERLGDKLLQNNGNNGNNDDTE
jgi:hypothetical protein